MAKAAPRCTWNRFRDWALVLMSCELDAKTQGLLGQGYNLGQIVYLLFSIVRSTSRDKMISEHEVDLLEVCELISWMTEIHFHLYPLYQPYLPLRTHLHREKVAEAISTARNFGICLHRFWNLAVGSAQREEADLPTLMIMVEHNPAIFSEHKPPGDHENCNAEFCRYNIIDSTRVEQLHKCLAQDCGEPLYFSPSELGKPYQILTWWVDKASEAQRVPYVVDERAARPYLAISHVWADGTGGGTRGQNIVNRCLWNYFEEVAELLGCSAIWWDTICIPTEIKARQKAISRMDQNFLYAAHTVIHDEYLVNFPWSDNGSPCLALLLSSWFTRAWTALELMRSRKERVWVIFRHPTEPTRYTIKNLEREVLAVHPALSSRGHWVASSLVTQLREQQFNCIGDLQKVLKTKSTSWPRDILIVASLFTGHDPKVSLPGYISHITRKIILGFVEIEESFLYHGHTTMAQKGPFSWCPSNLMDGSISTSTEEPERVYVDEDGAALGNWLCRWITSEEAKEVQPYSRHISVDWQIRSVLDQWEHCLLLRSPRNLNMQALLVIPVDTGCFELTGTKYDLLEAHFVGTIYTNLAWGINPPMVTVRLGKLTKNPVSRARDIVKRLRSLKGPPFMNGLLQKHLERIKEARRRSEESSG